MQTTPLLLLGLLAALTSTARGDVDNAKADQLYMEALKLREVNRAQSCAKFVEALTYNPQAIATHLSVARCDEEDGRTASAAARYREIIDRAINQKQDEFRQEAQRRLDALTAEIPHLTLWFVGEPAPGTQVLIDDKVVTVKDRTRLEVDPGERVIAVSAPGRITYRTKLVLGRKDDQGIPLPALDKLGASSRRTKAKVALIAGGALVATSVGVALIARSRYNDAKGRCPPDGEGTLVCGDAEDLSQLDSAKTLGNVGTVIGLVGLAGAVAGGVLWWTSPREHAKPGVARLDVFGGSHTAGVALHGRF